MSVMASQITRTSIVCSAVCSGANQRKHQSSASLAFVRGIHLWPVDSPNKGPVMGKMFPFDDVIMIECILVAHMQWTKSLFVISCGGLIHSKSCLISLEITVLEEQHFIEIDTLTVSPLIHKSHHIRQKLRYQFLSCHEDTKLIWVILLADVRSSSKSSSVPIEIYTQIAKYMGPTWVLPAPDLRWAPCWPHEPCYQGIYGIRWGLCLL